MFDAVAAEHVERRRLAVVEGHVLALMRIGRPWIGLSYSHMSPAANTPGIELEPGRAAHAAPLAELEPGGPGQHDVRHHADPDHHHVAVEPRSPLVTTPRTRLVGALEALDLVAPVDLHAMLLEHALEVAADLAAVEAVERRSPASRSRTSRHARRP